METSDVTVEQVGRHAKDLDPVDANHTFLHSMGIQI